MKAPTPTPSPTLTLTPTPTPVWWATPTPYPTSASTTFLDGIRPTVVEAYALAAEQGVQVYNISSSGIDTLFLTFMIVLIFATFIRMLSRMRKLGDKE